MLLDPIFVLKLGDMVGFLKMNYSKCKPEN